MLSGEEHDAVRPRKAEEDGEERRGVEHPLVAQQGARQRDAHEAAVAVDDGEALDLRLPAGFPANQQVRRRDRHHVGDCRNEERPQHIHHQPELVLHLGIGVHHQHRRDDLQHKAGELAAAVLVHNFRAVGDDAHQIQQQHDRRLLQNDPCH